jgi:hypothetical protein
MGTNAPKRIRLIHSARASKASRSIELACRQLSIRAVRSLFRSQSGWRARLRYIARATHVSISSPTSRSGQSTHERSHREPSQQKRKWQRCSWGNLSCVQEIRPSKPSIQCATTKEGNKEICRLIWRKVEVEKGLLVRGPNVG